MPADLLLRPGTAADLPEVADLYLVARSAAEDAGAMPPGIHPPHEVHAYVAGWDLTATELWVAAADDGRLVGFAHATPTWLDALYVLPEAAGRGIGSALLDLVRSTHPDGFGLWVFVRNRPARAFYGAHGLVEVTRTDGAENEERDPDIHLQWRPG